MQPNHTSARHHYLLLVLFPSALFLLAGIFLALQRISAWRSFAAKGNTPSVSTIELREDGFYPPVLAVTPGDTVTFTTTRGEQFWPASNLHPTHTLYPEFDPQEPIAENASWSFTFKKAGTWEYHDHLAPLYRGVIEVRGKGASAGKPCEDKDESATCWEKRIDAALKQGGVAAAFNVVEVLSSNPLFQQDCHGYAHTIGAAAYRLYAAGKDLQLSPKTSYCGYGFYHGFMETLLHERGSVEEARDFCTAVSREFGKETSDAEGACYHGIGHGAVDGSDQRAWGDVHTLMIPSMELCKAVADERDTSVGSFFYRCITGIYNAVEVLSADPRYRIEFLRKDPFSFCAAEPVAYQEPCYTNMVPIVLADGGNDFAAKAARIEKIREPEDAFSIRGTALSALFHEFTRFALAGEWPIAEGVRVCHSLTGRSRLACTDGLAGGHMKYGEPTKEYVKAFAFCRLPSLAEDERDVCFKHLLTRLRIWYAPVEARRVCLLADEAYRHYCAQQ